MIAAGGLRIIGTERHESRRIDNQLRGRSGRQGDPGSSRFYLSIEDNLMRIFGDPERTKGMLRGVGMREGEAIESNLLIAADRARPAQGRGATTSMPASRCWNTTTSPTTSAASSTSSAIS